MLFKKTQLRRIFQLFPPIPSTSDQASMSGTSGTSSTANLFRPIPASEFKQQTPTATEPGMQQQQQVNKTKFEIFELTQFTKSQGI